MFRDNMYALVFYSRSYPCRVRYECSWVHRRNLRRRALVRTSVNAFQVIIMLLSSAGGRLLETPAQRVQIETIWRRTCKFLPAIGLGGRYRHVLVHAPMRLD